MREHPSESQAPEPAPSAQWPIRDVALGLGVLLLFRCLALVPREWLIVGPKWVITGVVTLTSQLFLLAFPLVIARKRGLAGLFHGPRIERFVIDAALAFPILIAIFAALVCAGLLLNRLAPNISLTPGVFEQAASAQDYAFLAVVAVLAVAVAPVCEEAFFRGFLYTALRTRLGVPTAALVQSLIFALLHTLGAINGMGVFFLGLVLTAIYEWRKSLVTPILVHAGNNFLAVLGFVALMHVTANGPMLGVACHDDPEGVVVETVAPDSAAANAGIEPGDVVSDIDGQKLSGFTHLISVIRRHQPGDKVKIGIIRRGERLTVDVTLLKRPKMR